MKCSDKTIIQPQSAWRVELRVLTPKKKKKDDYEVMDVLINQMGGTLSQCVLTSNHHNIHFKHLIISSIMPQ